MSILQQVDEFILENIFQKIVNKIPTETPNLGCARLFGIGWILFWFHFSANKFAEDKITDGAIFLGLGVLLIILIAIRLHWMRMAIRNGMDPAHLGDWPLRLLFLVLVIIGLFVVQHPSSIGIDVCAFCFHYFLATKKPPPVFNHSMTRKLAHV